MVMIFQSEKARKHLLEKGFVFTFRKLTLQGRKLGKDWITDKHGGKKLADVIVCIAHEGTISPFLTQLNPFAFGTGFDSTHEWIEEIKRLNKPDPDLGLVGEVFCVVKRRN